MNEVVDIEEQSPETLISYMSKLTDADKKLIRHAFEFAQEAHKDHKRNSGEPYFNHLYATAKSLAEIDMDAATVAAGLLHDSIEDVDVEPSVIGEEFGSEVLFLVQGTTKLGKLKYRGAERHIESLRRLFVATSKDIRVLMIKLMDRRHNVKTLEYVRADKRERIASETLSIYAPLADRLGMGRLKRDLEDYSFKYVLPKEHERMKSILQESKLVREPQLEMVINKLKKNLVKHGVKGFRTESRIKGLYSLYKKLERKGGDMDKIHDIHAIRIIVGTVEDCYRALGAAHTLWHPLPGKIKDYIAFPKPNGYRSIHTTVLTDNAGPVEIQFRTEQMHREAQFGIASHLVYKESGAVADRGEKKKNTLWYRQLIPSLIKSSPASGATTKKANPPKWIDDLAVAHDVKEQRKDDKFMQEISDDFFSHRIFVFTPKGDVVDLPIDSSPIDFAYAIHSEIGGHVSGAIVNGKLVSLDTKLKNGDIVKIDTKNSSQPNEKWLDFVRTTIARRHITQALTRRKREKKV
jgi:(p)ppGpp synthase/HD superfamily hydrolase